MNLLKIGGVVFIWVTLMLAQTAKVAVMDLKASTFFDKEEIQALSNRFRSELVSTKKFEVMERSDMVELDRELALQLTSGFDANRVAEAGKKSGARYVIIGSIGKVGNQYTVDIKMVDCETSRIEESIIQDYKGSMEGMLKVMHSIAYRLAGIKEKKSTWKWVTAGLVAAGSVAVIVLLKGQATTPSGLPMPPNPPSIP